MTEQMKRNKVEILELISSIKNEDAGYRWFS